MKYLAKNLKLLREGRGIKQTEIKVYLGFKSTTWNNYETGVSKPGLDDLIRISKFFGIDETMLLHKDLSKTRSDQGEKNRLNLAGEKEQYMVREEEEEYKRICEQKDRIIEDKMKIIEAQQGQIDALKLATAQMETRLNQLDRKKK